MENFVDVSSKAAASPSDGYIATLGLSLQAEVEEVEGVGAADFLAVGFAGAGVVEPGGGVIDIFEGPVGGEKDAVGANFQDGVDYRLNEIGAPRPEWVGSTAPLVAPWYVDPYSEAHLDQVSVPNEFARRGVILDESELSST